MERADLYKVYEEWNVFRIGTFKLILDEICRHNLSKFETVFWNTKMDY